MCRIPPVFIIILFAASCHTNAITVVDSSATGADNGTSWDDAFVELQAGLAAAGPSGEVWVAAGVYSPAGPGGDRAAFTLQNGRTVCGGFLGTETDRAQRDPASHLTILSGDLNGDDPAVWGNMGDNSYHVVTAIGLTSAARLDGFTVTRGWAWQSTGTHSAGSGLYVIDSLLTIADCRVEANLAHLGAGLLTLNSPVEVINTTFHNNLASDGRGGRSIMRPPQQAPS